MANNKTNQDLKEQEKLQQEKVEERVSSVERFFNENKKLIWSIVGIILLIALGILCYQKFILQPKKAEAAQQMFPAETAFRQGNWDVALNGDGNALGFAEIINQYGKKAGKAVYFYAGACELQKGNYEQALSYLKKYTGKDAILNARALGAQGDAYTGLQKFSDAISCYEKAASQVDDMFAASYLFKAGVVSEEMGDSAKALSYYKKVKDQYPQSMEAYDIDKYISRIENAQ